MIHMPPSVAVELVLLVGAPAVVVDVDAGVVAVADPVAPHDGVRLVVDADADGVVGDDLVLLEEPLGAFRDRDARVLAVVDPVPADHRRAGLGGDPGAAVLEDLVRLDPRRPVPGDVDAGIRAAVDAVPPDGRAAGADGGDPGHGGAGDLVVLVAPLRVADDLDAVAAPADQGAADLRVGGAGDDEAATARALELAALDDGAARLDLHSRSLAVRRLADDEVRQAAGRPLEGDRRLAGRLDHSVALALSAQVEGLLDHDAALVEARPQHELTALGRPGDRLGERGVVAACADDDRPHATGNLDLGLDGRDLGLRLGLGADRADRLPRSLCLAVRARGRRPRRRLGDLDLHGGSLLEPLQRLEQPLGEVLDQLLALARLVAHLVAHGAEVDELVVRQRHDERVALVLQPLEVLALDEVDRQDQVVAADALLVLEEPLELLAAPLPAEVAGGDNRHEDLDLADGVLDPAPPVLAPADVLGVEEELDVPAEERDLRLQLGVEPLRDSATVVLVVLADVAQEDPGSAVRLFSGHRAPLRPAVGLVHDLDPVSRDPAHGVDDQPERPGPARRDRAVRVRRGRDVLRDHVPVLVVDVEVEVDPRLERLDGHRVRVPAL